MTRITLPPVKSAANLREHWSVKAKRVAQERADAFLLTPALKNFSGTITFTRYNWQRSDDDNNISACKPYRDGIAQRLGIDDGDPRITWLYRQERGKPAVVVEFESA